MKFDNFKAIDAGDATQSTLTSQAIDTSYWVAASLQANTAGTVAGTIKIQASNDHVTAPRTPTNWMDISQSLNFAVTGGGAQMLPKFDVSYQWMRVVYTKTAVSSTPTIDAIVKSVGF